MAKKNPGSWSDTPGRSDANASHVAGMEADNEKPAKATATITLPRLDIRVLQIKLVGDSELICHRWSDKAKKEMLGKQMGTASAGKTHKDPERDYRDSLYPFPGGGFGFPAIAFKGAAVSACTSLGRSVTKVAARQSFHVIGELVKIEGEPRMREDMVKLPTDVADIRYRAGFTEWSVVITLRYNARVLTAEQIVNLFNTAGFAVGVGEWRPEKKGMFGLFHVA